MSGAWAVLTAAGSGLRFGSPIPKALAQVAGRSLLAHALDALLQVDDMQGVVITVTPGKEAAFAAEAATVADSSQWITVEGGASRQASVFNGLRLLPGFAERTGRVLAADSPILIHDAARPFAPPEFMNRLAKAIRLGTPAVIPGLRVTDTIKVVSDDDLPVEGSPVTQTPPRAMLRAIQTPQTFRWDVIWDAHQNLAHLSHSEASAPTDDAALVELNGGTVYVVEGDPRAYKITVADDLEKARKLAELR